MIGSSCVIGFPHARWERGVGQIKQGQGQGQGAGDRENDGAQSLRCGEGVYNEGGDLLNNDTSLSLFDSARLHFENVRPIFQSILDLFTLSR